MSTLIRSPTCHLRFVPAHRQSDDMTASLPPAKWSMELVLISIEAGRGKYLDQPMIHMILAHAIQGVCQMTPALTKFFFRGRTTLAQGRYPNKDAIRRAPSPDARLTQPQ